MKDEIRLTMSCFLACSSPEVGWVFAFRVVFLGEHRALPLREASTRSAGKGQARVSGAVVSEFITALHTMGTQTSQVWFWCSDEIEETRKRAFL